jgi:DNA ligase-associated metallophosphoesterase
MKPMMIEGESVILRPDRSLFWPRRSTIVIADPHFGKAETFRAAGLPIPGHPDETLLRLGRALDETVAERLIVLGDFWHARSGRDKQVLHRLADWRAGRPFLQIELIRGNHDRAGPPPEGWGIWRSSPWHDKPYLFAHIPFSSETEYVMAGHIHPGVVVRGVGRQRLRLPCFRIGPRVTVLPAFGTFTGLSTTSVIPCENVFAIAGDEVIHIPNGNSEPNKKPGGNR